MSETLSPVSRALDGIYAALEHGSDWQETVRCGAEATGADRFNLVTVGDDAARQFSHPFDPESALEYLVSYLPRDIRVPRLRDRPSGLVTTQDLMTSQEIARCPVHQEFYRRHPECWNMQMVFGRSEGGVVAVVAHRRKGAPDPDGKSGAKLMVLANQMARIAHLKDLVPSGSIARDGALAAFDALPDPFAIFDVNGLVIHLNRPARDLIGPRNGLRLSGRRLLGTQSAVSDRITRAVARTIGVLHGGVLALPNPIEVPRPTSRMPLFLRFFAAPAGDGHSRYGVVKFVDPAEARIPDIAFVRSATGLSNGEAALAIAIYRGLTVKAFADEAGLSEQTIRKRLKQVCDKLGVRRQPEIAIRIAALANV